MNIKNRIGTVLLVLTLIDLHAQKSYKTYKAYKEIACAGNGSWDYLSVDVQGRRLYVSHGDKVEVIDVDKDEKIGEIAAGKSVHGIAIARAEGKGFISNSKSNDITVFDLNNNTVTKTIPSTGSGVDAINYDLFTHTVLVHNSKTSNITVINAATAEVKGTVENLGKLESGAADGKGFYYVNLEKENAIAKIDIQTMKLVATFSLAAESAPAGLAIDTKNGLLFCGARSNNLVVMNTSDGKIVTTLPIPDHNDAVVFDAETRLLYVSTISGEIMVLMQENRDGYKVEQRVATKFLSKTMAIDTKTKKIYLPSADFDGTDEKKSKMLPESFKALVFKQ